MPTIQVASGKDLTAVSSTMPLTANASTSRSWPNELLWGRLSAYSNYSSHSDIFCRSHNNGPGGCLRLVFHATSEFCPSSSHSFRNMALKQKQLTPEQYEKRIQMRAECDAQDPLTIVYTPWEETPGGKLTPKPEGYDEYYQNHGMSFYETKDL